jgi:hypothetical protein
MAHPPRESPQTWMRGSSSQSEADYAEQSRERLEKQLHRRAKALGFQLTKIEPGVDPKAE